MVVFFLFVMWVVNIINDRSNVSNKKCHFHFLLKDVYLMVVSWRSQPSIYIVKKKRGEGGNNIVEYGEISISSRDALISHALIWVKNYDNIFKRFSYLLLFFLAIHCIVKHLEFITKELWLFKNPFMLLLKNLMQFFQEKIY